MRPLSGGGMYKAVIKTDKKYATDLKHVMDCIKHLKLSTGHK